MPRLFGMVTTSHSHRYTPYALRSFLDTTPLASGDRLLLIDNNGDLDRSSLPNSAQLEIHSAAVPRSFAANGNYLRKIAIENQLDLYYMNNDLIFTPLWSEALEQAPGSIISPCSNREFSYSTPILKLGVEVTLENYLAGQDELIKIAALHRRQQHGLLPVLILPFFCVRIPNRALLEVGEFDEAFGKGGGEDFDYCLRAHIKGFSVNYALSSFILHFGGKSTWSGAESTPQQLERERIFFTEFERKWGTTLTDVVLRDKIDAVTKSPELTRSMNQKNFSEIIKALTPPAA